MTKKPTIAHRPGRDGPGDAPEDKTTFAPPPQVADHRQRVAAERRERMRARLLQSALQLIANNGLAGMSVDEVIRAACVSRGTFYNYFPSPEALVRELAAGIADQLARTVEPAVRGYKDPVLAVARGIRLASRLALHYPAVAGFLVRVGWSGEQGTRMLEFVRDDIEEGFRQGLFRRMPIIIALNIVVGAVLGSIQRMLESDSREDCSEQAAATALRALGVDAATADEIAATRPDVDEDVFVGALAATLDIPEGD